MKPELLLPAGNTESFYAALEGGADAIYLGVDQFNARKRAKNFSVGDVPTLVKVAKDYNALIYITINTLIKNKELSGLLDILYILNQTGIEAVIIQDWGVYYFLRKFFPDLPFHASTQLSNHNSFGTDYSNQKGFERVILARELTLSEVKKISKNSKTDLEIFVHGALCYSFSGQCLFSSYLGGMSANRGQCRQPCRRLYRQGMENKYLFSLKDLQLIDFLPKFSKMGIRSLKIEGRMKSPEYVYQVATAYRMALDDFSKIPQAKKILQYDFGREKTSYFMGHSVKNAISQNSYTGILVGLVEDINSQNFVFTTRQFLKIGDRLRIMPKSGINSQAIKIKSMRLFPENTNTENAKFGHKVSISNHKLPIEKGDKIFLIGKSGFKFKTKLPLIRQALKMKFPQNQKKSALKQLYLTRNNAKTTELFVRIDSLSWLRKIYLDSVDGLILNLSQKELEAINLNEKFIRNNMKKIYIELPLFISEDNISFYEDKCYEFSRHGIKNFVLSHLSQSLFFKNMKKINLITNEHVYVLNDASARFLLQENIKEYIYPLETDIDNLFNSNNKSGIIPMYFHPQLFYSRMPISVENNETFEDNSEIYRKSLKDGMTNIIPLKPVSILQYKNKFEKKGFNKFLIDFSYQKPSKNLFNKILKKLSESEAERPSTGFNFKKGLW
jgi:putative protease